MILRVHGSPRNARQAGALVLLVMTAFSVGGCSFMLLHPDRREQGPDGAPLCTRSWDGAVLDGIFTAASGGAALYMWSSDDATRKVEAVGLGIASVLWLSSAI